jgi:hypothetical protein
MKQLILMCWLIASFTCAGQVAYACSCQKITGTVVYSNGSALKPNPEEVKKWRLEQTDFAFFIGQVVEIEKVKMRWSRSPDEREPMKRVTVRIEKYWTGVKTPEIVVYTGMGKGDCGVPYVKGKQYFFATSRVDGLLKTMACWSSDVDSDDARAINTAYGDATLFHRSRTKQNKPL